MYSSQGLPTLVHRDKVSVSKSCKNMDKICCMRGSINKLQVFMKRNAGSFITKVEDELIFVREMFKLIYLKDKDNSIEKNIKKQKHCANKACDAMIEAQKKLLVALLDKLKYKSWHDPFEIYKTAKQSCLKTQYEYKNGIRCLSCQPESNIGVAIAKTNTVVKFKYDNVDAAQPKSFSTSPINIDMTRVDLNISLNQEKTCAPILNDCKALFRFTADFLDPFTTIIEYFMTIAKDAAQTPLRFKDRFNKADIDSCYTNLLDPSTPVCGKVCSAVFEEIITSDDSLKLNKPSSLDGLYLDIIKYLGDKNSHKLVDNITYKFEFKKTNTVENNVPKEEKD